MRNMNPLGFSDNLFLIEKLTRMGDPFQKSNAYIDWAIFKTPIYKAFAREENLHMKVIGTSTADWNENQHKLCQNKIDALWTKKYYTTFYGHKSHKKSDAKAKLIEAFVDIDVPEHDSQNTEIQSIEKTNSKRFIR